MVYFTQAVRLVCKHKKDTVLIHTLLTLMRLSNFGVIIYHSCSNVLCQVLHGEQYLELYKPLPTSGISFSAIKVPTIYCI